MSEAASTVVDVETAVKSRYSEAAKAAEVSLCCPTAYDPKLLKGDPPGGARSRLWVRQPE